MWTKAHRLSHSKQTTIYKSGFILALSLLVYLKETRSPIWCWKMLYSIRLENYNYGEDSTKLLHVQIEGGWLPPLPTPKKPALENWRGDRIGLGGTQRLHEERWKTPTAKVDFISLMNTLQVQTSWDYCQGTWLGFSCPNLLSILIKHIPTPRMFWHFYLKNSLTFSRLNVRLFVSSKTLNVKIKF